MAPLTNLQTRAVETLIHPCTNQATFRDTGPLVFERGKGVYIYDTEGKAYLEGIAGLSCTALGYDNEELVEAAAAQMRKLPSRTCSRRKATIRRSSSPRSSKRSRRSRSRRCSSAIPARRRTTAR